MNIFMSMAILLYKTSFDSMNLNPIHIDCMDDWGTAVEKMGWIDFSGWGGA